VRPEDLHEVVERRLRRSGQRYTANRRALVDALREAPQPVTVAQLVEVTPSVVQSSAYRNLAVLERADAVHRVVTTDDFARYELAQDLTEHHHHLVCRSCGGVTDFTLSPEFEQRLESVLAAAAEGDDFDSDDHRLDVLGTCSNCS